jgi:hypothetical protein
MQDHFRKEGQKRVGAYDPLVGGVRFLLEVDADTCSEEEQDELAEWVTNALVAKAGNDLYEKEIIEFVNSVAFYVGRRGILNPEQVRKVQEIFHWAAAFVLGFEKAKGGSRPAPGFKDFTVEVPWKAKLDG